MSELPDKLWVRRGEARAYLQVSQRAFSRLIEAGALHPLYFEGQARAYFERGEVEGLRPRRREGEAERRRGGETAKQRNGERARRGDGETGREQPITRGGKHDGE